MKSNATCLIIEDDPDSAEVAGNLLKNHFNSITLVGTAGNLEAGYQLLMSKKPQLVILDINLPDGTAFDLLKKIQTPDFKIIFTTAFSKYAIEAFKFSALDYLLKPYTPSEFVTSVEKALTEIDKENHHQLLETFRYNFESQTNSDKKLVLKNAEAVHVVPLKDIIQAKSDNNYTLFLVTDGRKILISKPLKEFDQKLNNYGFLRVHQSHLVNLEHARSYNKREDSLLLSDTTEVPVSQSKKSLLWEYFDKLV